MERDKSVIMMITTQKMEKMKIIIIIIIMEKDSPAGRELKWSKQETIPFWEDYEQ